MAGSTYFRRFRPRPPLRPLPPVATGASDRSRRVWRNTSAHPVTPGEDVTRPRGNPTPDISGRSVTFTTLWQQHPWWGLCRGNDAAGRHDITRRYGRPKVSTQDDRGTQKVIRCTKQDVISRETGEVAQQPPHPSTRSTPAHFRFGWVDRASTTRSDAARRGRTTGDGRRPAELQPLIAPAGDYLSAIARAAKSSISPAATSGCWTMKKWRAGMTGV